MNTATKAAIVLGAVSFGVTLWVLRGPSAPPDDPAPPPPPARAEAPPGDAPRAIPGDFDAARRAAERIGQTPEGLAYQEEAGPALSNALQDRLASCLSDASLGLSPFTIVVGVAPDGIVRSTWASPETPLASCVLHRVTGAVLPLPPIPDVWLAANIKPDTAAPEAEPER